MITDLEKQFFDTFGIEPITIYGCRCKSCAKHGINADMFKCMGEKCEYFVKGECFYPSISSYVLLKIAYCFKNLCIRVTDFNECKEFILEYSIKHINEDIKHQVQALFKEQ